MAATQYCGENRSQMFKKSSDYQEVKQHGKDNLNRRRLITGFIAHGRLRRGS